MTLYNSTGANAGEWPKEEHLSSVNLLFSNLEPDPKQKPEIEPEQLPKEDPGQADPDEDDDDDETNPFTDPEIGDDPDEITRKTTIF